MAPAVAREAPDVGREVPAVARGAPAVGRQVPAVARGAPGVGRQVPLAPHHLMNIITSHKHIANIMLRFPMYF